MPPRDVTIPGVNTMTNDPRPTTPATTPTPDTQDHVVLVIPQQTVAQLLANHPDGDILDAFLSWWYANADGTRYRGAFAWTRTATPETVHAAALAELERMDALLADGETGIRAFRSWAHAGAADLNDPTVLAVHWMDVTAFIWSRMVPPMEWIHATA
jgi:hypothetical protein